MMGFNKFKGFALSIGKSDKQAPTVNPPVPQSPRNSNT